MADIREWSELLRRSVQQVGPRVAWVVGMTVLGYPPTWDPSVADAAKVRAAITALAG